LFFNCLIKPFDLTTDIVIEILVTHNMLHRCAVNNLARFGQQPVENVAPNSMCNTKPTCKAAPAAIELHLLLVVVPNSVIKLKVKPLRDVWCLTSDHLNTSALLFFNCLIKPFNLTFDDVIEIVVTHNMLHRCAINHLARFGQQPVAKVAHNSMCNTKPTCEAAPAAIEFNLLLVKVPDSVIELEVKPLRDVWCLTSDHLNTMALLLSMFSPIQDVGLVDQAVIPQAGRHFPPQHANPPSLYEFTDLARLHKSGWNVQLRSVATKS
jgi:hypothetical protein